MRADNERLLTLLKNTSEYGEMTDADIIKESRQNKSGFFSGASGSGRSKSQSGSGKGMKKQGSSQINLSNEWIPTEAVRAI